MMPFAVYSHRTNVATSENVDLVVSLRDLLKVVCLRHSAHKMKGNIQLLK
jgi:hypothetical protein